LEPQRTAQPADKGAGEGNEKTAQQRREQAEGPGSDAEETRL
jgi:hypothetical protein